MLLGGVGFPAASSLFGAGGLDYPRVQLALRRSSLPASAGTARAQRTGALPGALGRLLTRGVETDRLTTTLFPCGARPGRFECEMVRGNPDSRGVNLWRFPQFSWANSGS